KTALLFQVGNGSFALPLLQIDSVITLNPDIVHQVGQSSVIDYKGQKISLVYLNAFLFGSETNIQKPDVSKGRILEIIVINYNNRKIGLIVDKLLRQQEIVIKPLQ